MQYVFTPIHFILLIPIIPFFYAGKLVKNTEKAIFGCSILLFVLEVIKQVTFIIVGYDFFWFPFQFCSIPLYIWLLYPLRNTRYFKWNKNFLMAFSMVSALGALAYPAGMFMYPGLFVAHSFLWHYLLIFMSSVCMFDKDKDLSVKGFFGGAAVFLISAAIATVFNVTLSPLCNNRLNMFYINPMRGPNTQPVISWFVKQFHIQGHGLYLFAIILAAFIVHNIVKAVSNRKAK